MGWKSQRNTCCRHALMMRRRRKVYPKYFHLLKTFKAYFMDTSHNYVSVLLILSLSSKFIFFIFSCFVSNIIMADISIEILAVLKSRPDWSSLQNCRSGRKYKYLTILSKTCLNIWRVVSCWSATNNWGPSVVDYDTSKKRNNQIEEYSTIATQKKKKKSWIIEWYHM